jgi:hypothetical protein
MAFPLQSPAMVHVTPQTGKLECRAEQPSHVAPAKVALQPQLQPLVWSPLTVAAWPLQFAAFVHVTPQVG